MSEKGIDSKRAAGFADNGEIEITITPNGGACFGVVRAIKLGQQAAKNMRRDPKPVFSFGPLIHNPKVVNELESQGVRTVNEAKDVIGGTVILRSHGVRKEIEKDFKDRGVRVVDATCPLVKKPQRIAQSLGEKGYFLVLVGDVNHPEVRGVLSYFNRPDYLVTYRPEDVDAVPSTVEKVGIVAQTTIEFKVLEAVIARCKERFREVAVYNTICDATSIRQEEAASLAKHAEVVVVVGGRNSSNTSKLVKICKDYQPNTHLIEDLEEIDRAWFDGKKKIGITGGASTPMEFVDKVGRHIADLLGGA